MCSAPCSQRYLKTRDLALKVNITAHLTNKGRCWGGVGWGGSWGEGTTKGISKYFWPINETWIYLWIGINRRDAWSSAFGFINSFFEPSQIWPGEEFCGDCIGSALYCHKLTKWHLVAHWWACISQPSATLTPLRFISFLLWGELWWEAVIPQSVAFCMLSSCPCCSDQCCVAFPQALSLQASCLTFLAYLTNMYVGATWPQWLLELKWFTFSWQCHKFLPIVVFPFRAFHTNALKNFICKVQAWLPPPTFNLSQVIKSKVAFLLVLTHLKIHLVLPNGQYHSQIWLINCVCTWAAGGHNCLLGSVCLCPGQNSPPPPHTPILLLEIPGSLVDYLQPLHSGKDQCPAFCSSLSCILWVKVTILEEINIK